MQNKANFRRHDNESNLSYNKHLRRKTTPGGAKKQSQFKTNWQKGRDPCQTSPNTSYEIRDTILRAYKAPLAGVPPLQANRAHKTTPFMQNKANFRRAANDRNLSHSKGLRKKPAPAAKKNKANSRKAQNDRVGPLQSYRSDMDRDRHYIPARRSKQCTQGSSPELGTYYRRRLLRYLLGDRLQRC